MNLCHHYIEYSWHSTWTIAYLSSFYWVLQILLVWTACMFDRNSMCPGEMPTSTSHVGRCSRGIKSWKVDSPPIPWLQAMSR